MATSFRDELRNTFRNGDTLNILLLINVGVFLIIRIIDALLGLFMVDSLGSKRQFLGVIARKPLLEMRRGASFLAGLMGP